LLAGGAVVEGQVIGGFSLSLLSCLQSTR